MLKAVISLEEVKEVPAGIAAVGGICHRLHFSTFRIHGDGSGVGSGGTGAPPVAETAAPPVIAGGSSFNSGAETAVGVGPGEGSGGIDQSLVFQGQVGAVSSLDGPATVHFGVGALGGSLIAVDVDIILGDLAAQQQSQFFFSDVAAHTVAVGVGSTQGYVVERVLLGCAGGHNKMTSHQAEYQDQRQQFAQCCVALHDLSSLNI